MITWGRVVPGPDDYRISWAPSGEDYTSWNAANDDRKGNAYPAGPERSHTVTGLPDGAEYKVRVRARFDQGWSNPWSGPWARSTGAAASPPVRTLLWFHTMTVADILAAQPVAYRGVIALRQSEAPWEATLPDDTIVRIASVATLGVGGPLYWTVLTASGGVMHDHALLMVLGAGIGLGRRHHRWGQFVPDPLRLARGRNGLDTG